MILQLVYFLIDCIGQRTQLINYSCSSNSSNIDFSLSNSSHSAWDSTSNCLISRCRTNENSACRLSPTPCFDYRSITNQQYCAPASLCSILQPCMSNSTCPSNESVCIVNSCCQSRNVCLPIVWTALCPLRCRFNR